MALLEQQKRQVFLLKTILRLQLSVVFCFPENMHFREGKEEGKATKIHFSQVSAAESSVRPAGVLHDRLLNLSQAIWASDQRFYRDAFLPLCCKRVSLKCLIDLLANS